jgi:uncharacterized protein YodC (DUF2158 family)
MKEDIKVGVEVRLITGGPVMVVKAVSGEMATCEWEVVGRVCVMQFKLSNLLLVAVQENKR